MHVCVVYFVGEIVAWNSIKCFTDVQCDKECSVCRSFCVDAVIDSLCEVCEKSVCGVEWSETVLCWCMGYVWGRELQNESFYYLGGSAEECNGSV